MNFFPDTTSLKRLNEPEIQFSSPLKKQRLFSEDSSSEKVEKISSFLLCHETIQEVESAVKLFNGENCDKLIQESLKLIQDWVDQKGFLYAEKLRLSRKCASILNRPWNLDQKLAELGTLYYYLSCNKKVPEHELLLQARRAEIEQWVNEVREAHCKILGDKGPLHLSEEVLYFKRTLMRMIFTSDGLFNWGGLLAVRQLLDRNIESIVGREMRKQMVAVVNRLIEDPSFRAHFETPFEVHEKAAPYVRIDLMLPKTAPLQFTHVRWALLAALFSVEGQYEEPNCYAVSNTLIAQRHFLENSIQYLIEALKTGCIIFEGKKIPITPLIEADLSQEEESFLDLSEKQSHELLGFLEEYCSKSTEQPQNNSERASNGPFIKLFGDEGLYAKALYQSQRRSLLQLILLRYIQFFGNNTTQTLFLSFNEQNLISKKLELIREIKQLVRAISTVEDEKFKIFSTVLDEELKNHFFSIDHVDQCSFKADHVYFNFLAKKLKYTGDQNAYLDFQTMRRLYVYEDERLIPIDSIKEFQRQIYKILKRIPVSKNDLLLQEDLEDIFSSKMVDRFQKNVANYLVQKNKLAKSFDASFYLESDAFLLKQSGTLIFFSNEYIKDFTPHRFKARTIDLWFKQLQKAINEHVKLGKLSLLEERVMPALLAGHAFNLLPEGFKEFLESEEALLQELVLPAQNLLKKPFSQDQMQSLLTDSGILEQLQTVELNALYQCKTAEEFKEAVLKEASRHNLTDEFIKNFGKMLTSISSEARMNVVDLVLKRLHITQTDGEKIFKQLEEKWTSGFCSSFALAQILQEAFSQLELPQFHDLFKLDNLIRRVHELPRELVFGNLLWSQPLAKKEFVYCSLAYDFFKNEVGFFRKKQGYDEPFEYLNSLLEMTLIFFPN